MAFLRTERLEVQEVDVVEESNEEDMVVEAAVEPVELAPVALHLAEEEPEDKADKNECEDRDDMATLVWRDSEFLS